MKYTIATLLILMFFAQCNYFNPSKPGKDIFAQAMADSLRKDSIFNDTAKCDKIVIDYVDEVIGTAGQVNCDLFDETFSFIKKRKVIEKGSKLFAVYDSLFTLFIDSKDQIPNRIDVRMKIETYSGKRVLKIICVDYWGEDFYFQNTSRYKSNGPLKKYLLKHFWNFT